MARIDDTTEKELRDASNATNIPSWNKEWKKHEEKLRWHDKQISLTYYFMIGVVFVCFISFLGFLYAYFQFDITAFNGYHSIIKENTDVIKGLKDQKFSDLDKRIKLLESLHPTK